MRKLRILPFVFILLPIDIAIAISLLLTQFVALFLWRRSAPPDESISNSSATILILNWDGKHLLEECLPKVLAAICREGGAHRVLVVDNGSTDGSVQFVRERFPEAELLPLDRNYGFVGGNNRGVEVVKTEIVVLLNNDMIVDEGFLGPLLAGFRDPSVFAVTSQIFFADPTRRREETGKTRAEFKNGFFYFRHDDISAADADKNLLPVFWAGGGSCAFDRRKYLQIGGLDSLYHPFYVEDTDLSYQAWKRGWKCLLAPSSRVIHKHRATTSRKFGHRFVDNTIRKNMYLFIWKNVTDFKMTLEHVINLPRIHGQCMMQQGVGFELRAYLNAVAQFPAALLRRLRSLPASRYSDREVMERSQT